MDSPLCTSIPQLRKQDAAKLEGGAFYGDRAVQAKHLSMGFTSYSKADVDKLWANMEKMAEKVGRQRGFMVDQDGEAV